MECDIMETVPLPIIIENGGRYVAAWCPLLDIATQGRDEKEARNNMDSLVKWYFEDADTPKPKIKTMMSMSVSIANIPVSIPKGVKLKNETSRSLCS